MTLHLVAIGFVQRPCLSLASLAAVAHGPTTTTLVSRRFPAHDTAAARTNARRSSPTNVIAEVHVAAHGLHLVLQTTVERVVEHIIHDCACGWVYVMLHVGRV